MKHNFKIIAGDNYGRDGVSERAVLVGLTEAGAKAIVEILNREHSGGSVFYRVEPYEYKPYIWEP